MKRLLRGSVVLAVAVGFLSCSGDPTSDFREPSGIVATPTTLFIDIGETKPVIAALQDDQGNQIAADFVISAVGSGLTVVHDTAYLHTTAGTSIRNQVRFQVTGTAIANSSFTLTAENQTLVVPVRVTPAAVDIVISNPTPQWGDTITLTAPPGVLFNANSVVTFAGGPPGDIVSLSPDRTVLTVVPGPNTLGAVTITHTTVTYDETLDFTITSNGTVTSPPLVDLTGAVFSNQTPILGEVVTLTLPAGIKVLPDSFLPDGSIGVLNDSGLVIEGAVNPRAVSVSADSSVISFIPAPNSDSFATVRGVVPSPLPQFPQILSTTIKVTTPTVDSLPATVSSTAPAVNVPVVLTSTDPNFTFVEPGSVTVGGSAAIVTGQTLSTLTFLPTPGSTGNVASGAVDVVGFPLPLPSTAPNITVSSTVPALPGSSSTATAPPLPIPALDGTAGIYDAGTFAADIIGFGPFDQAYRVNIATAGDYTFTVGWDNAADVDVAFCGAADCSDGAFLAASVANPEVGTLTLAPGTYYLVLNLFVGDVPAWVSLKVQHAATPPPAP